VARALHGLGKAHAQAAAMAANRPPAASPVRRISRWPICARAAGRPAQRLASTAMLKDNAEIARFRREAGLVPVLDEDMAGIMVGLNGSDVESARVPWPPPCRSGAADRPNPRRAERASGNHAGRPLAEAPIAQQDSEAAKQAAAALAAAQTAARAREDLAARADGRWPPPAWPIAMAPPILPRFMWQKPPGLPRARRSRPPAPSRRHACAVERARARRNAEGPGCD
jgi:hypothetical protein